MYSKLRFWLSIVAVSSLVLYLIFGNSLQDEICKNFKIAKHLEFEGVIKKKYLDTLEHNYSILEIEKFESRQKLKINLTNDRSKLFSFVQESDTIIKTKGTKFEVRRNGLTKYFDLDFNCK